MDCDVEAEKDGDHERDNVFVDEVSSDRDRELLASDVIDDELLSDGVPDGLMDDDVDML